MHLAVNALAATTGGAVTMLTPFLTELRRLERDWRVTVYIANPVLELSLDGITVVSVRTSGWWRAWLELFALERRARKDGADVMLNLLNSGSLVPHLPSITWQRNSLYFDRQWLHDQSRRRRLDAALRRNVALLTCRASAATVTPSQTMADFVRTWPLGRNLRVETIAHGVDTERFTIARDRQPDRWFTIGVMGHAAAHRGLTRAVLVLNEVRNGGVNARLLLTVPRHANPASQDTIDEAAQVADRLGLSDFVVFGGASEDPVAWYQCLDLLMVPSESESFCFPVVEAFASGLPVVTSGLPVLREIAGDLALHGDTFTDMASRVLEIYQESEEQKLRRRVLARRRAGDFSWAETAAKVQALVTETASKPGMT